MSVKRLLYMVPLLQFWSQKLKIKEDSKEDEGN
ncbi:unnamed protein product [Thlaspi arvense]|uniref:Uncharacterized protein n=1 Tax=Thlaspi arvense TaxID=13288 RepID=A0AAU9SDY7_THLAR|nr:unnamed protein product [Thlaspi arvense]